MKVSRAPEKRAGTNKGLLYLSVIVAVVIVGVLITYFTTGFQSPSATGDQTGVAETASRTPVQQLALPTVVAPPTATPAPVLELKLLESEPDPLPGFIPDVKFGEVLSEGFVNVELPGDNLNQAWYTFQVDTATRDITLYFAFYNDSLDTIVRTVQIDSYTQGQDLTNAELTVFYPEGPERTIGFDGAEGTIILTQQYRQPYGPSLFSAELRVALVNQRMELQDQSGDITTELQLDLSGLSDSELIVFKSADPKVVERVLDEIQELVGQIEDRRLR